MKYIIFNWKTYISDIDGGMEILNNVNLEDIDNTCNIIFAPPALLLSDLKEDFDDFLFSTQDLSVDESPHTGRISAAMVRKLGIGYAIVGHYETRKSGVTNEMVISKAINAIENEITPIICISSLDELREIVDALETTDETKYVVAYEPIEYIGAEEPISYEALEKFIEDVKTITSVPVIYGGSVFADNVEDIMDNPSIDGVLVGRSGTNIDEVNSIINKTCR